MLPAQVGEKLAGGLGTAGFYIRRATADPFRGFRKVLTFPFQVRGQCFVEGRSGILAMPSGVFFQLCLTFRFQLNHVHGWVFIVSLQEP
jgi:hypothetical protein